MLLKLRPILPPACILTLFCAACAPQAQENSSAPIHAQAAHLDLGESLRRVSRIYPEVESCPAAVELGGRIRRVHLSSQCAKSLPGHVSDLWLGFQGKHLVEIQMMYDTEYTRNKPAGAVADDMVALYGPPHYSQGKYWWSDGATVLRVFNAELPQKNGASSAIGLRTSLQLVEAGLFRR